MKMKKNILYCRCVNPRVGIDLYSSANFDNLLMLWAILGRRISSPSLMTIKSYVNNFEIIRNWYNLHKVSFLLYCLPHSMKSHLNVWLGLLWGTAMHIHEDEPWHRALFFFPLHLLLWYQHHQHGIPFQPLEHQWRLDLTPKYRESLKRRRN